MNPEGPDSTLRQIVTALTGFSIDEVWEEA
jgi:hypothetical protein